MKKMTLIDKAFSLKRTPMFSTLELDLLLPIADKLGMTYADVNEVIFDIKEQAYSMYLIIQGHVDIYDQSNMKLASLSEGAFFGEEAIFNGRPREYRAVSKGQTELLVLSGSDLLVLIHEYPKVATGFLEVYTKAYPFRPR